MICKQEEITDITREAINKIQLDKLNAVLKKEKERQGFYRDLPERLESLADLKALPFTTESDLAQKEDLRRIVHHAHFDGSRRNKRDGGHEIPRVLSVRAQK